MAKKSKANLDELRIVTQDMRDVANQLEKIPEDKEWTQSELEVLEDLRHEGLKIVREVEAIFEMLFEGKS